ncbi:Hypothetical protein ABZS17G119_00785 [Kosakonia cowanii]
MLKNKLIKNSLALKHYFQNCKLHHKTVADSYFIHIFAFSSLTLFPSLPYFHITSYSVQAGNNNGFSQ